MPGRYEHLDSDEYRLPEGMQRIGYDADTQVYTFRDVDGSIWESEPGNTYGQLHRPGTTPMRNQNPAAFAKARPEAFRGEDWRYMAPWFLLVALVLLAVWHFFGPTIIHKCEGELQSYRVMPGDTCWQIAESKGTTVEQLTKINRGLSCDTLRPGMQICTP